MGVGGATTKNRFSKNILHPPHVLYDTSLSGSDFVQLSIIIGLFFRFALLLLYSVNITKYYGTFSKIFFIPGVWEQAGVWALSQRKASRKSL